MTEGHEALSGIALPLAAFEVVKEASLTDDVLQGGRSALAASREGAIDRARHVLLALEDAGVPPPETFVVAQMPTSDAVVESWHSVPLYPVSFSDGRMMQAVVDPFLRHAPLGLLDWQGQLGVADVELVPAHEIAAAAPYEASTMLDAARLDVTTKRGGTGTAADSHGLAKLLRAWLKDPSDATQVERFRHLFGEVAWRSLQTAYPKLVQQVELELKNRG